MKPSLLTLLVLLAVQLLRATVHAAPSSGDFVAQILFPPELILQNADAIGLTDEQRDFITGEMSKVQEKFDSLKQRVDKESDAAAALLRQDHVDEAASLAQIDKLFGRENEIRRAHFALLISFKAKLTPEQSRQLQELRKQQAANPNDNPQLAIQEKVKRVQAGMEKWASEGRDPSEIGEQMQELEPLMKRWKFKEAGQLLDRVLKTLDAK